MPFEYKNKLFVVTGGAQGIGLALSEHILNKGGKVAISDVNQETGIKVQMRLEKQHGKNCVTFIKADVRDKAAFEALWDEAEKAFNPPLPVSVLVNNAGVGESAGRQLCIDVNFGGVVTGTYLAVDRMSKAKDGTNKLRNLGGKVVNVASLAGLADAERLNISAYSFTKGGVVALVQDLGTKEYFSKHGVTFNALCPGFVDTAIFNTKKELYDEV